MLMKLINFEEKWNEKKETVRVRQPVVNDDQYQCEKEFDKSEHHDEACKSIFVFADGRLGRHEVNASTEQCEKAGTGERKCQRCLFAKDLVE